MNEHLEPGQLQAMLDHELETGEARTAREHLATCIECRRRMATTTEANEQLSGALRLLDMPREATAIRPMAPPPSTEQGGWRRNWVSLRAAAMVAIFAAGASATIPGSPVRGWLFGDEAEEAAVAAPMAARIAVDEDVPAAGVGVEPADGALDISLSEIEAGVEIRASIVDRPRGGVYGNGAASTGRFRSGEGSITVTGVSAGALTIEIPRSASRATVAVNGEIRLIKSGDRLELSSEQGDTAAAQVLLEVR